MDYEKSALLLNVTIFVDWKFVLALGSILLAWLRLK